MVVMMVCCLKTKGNQIFLLDRQLHDKQRSKTVRGRLSLKTVAIRAAVGIERSLLKKIPLTPTASSLVLSFYIFPTFFCRLPVLLPKVFTTRTLFPDPSQFLLLKAPNTPTLSTPTEIRKPFILIWSRVKLLMAASLPNPESSRLSLLCNFIFLFIFFDQWQLKNQINDQTRAHLNVAGIDSDGESRRDDFSDYVIVEDDRDLTSGEQRAVESNVHDCNNEVSHVGTWIPSEPSDTVSNYPSSISSADLDLTDDISLPESQESNTEEFMQSNYEFLNCADLDSALPFLIDRVSLRPQISKFIHHFFNSSLRLILNGTYTT